MPLLHRMPTWRYWQALRRPAERYKSTWLPIFSHCSPLFPRSMVVSSTVLFQSTVFSHVLRVQHFTRFLCGGEARDTSTFLAVSYDEPLANDDFLCNEQAPEEEEWRGGRHASIQWRQEQPYWLEPCGWRRTGKTRPVVFPHVILTWANSVSSPPPTVFVRRWIHRLCESVCLARVLEYAACYMAGANMRLQNSDDCSACGGPGELLCCDGCTRSFHFTCIDPPKDTLPDGEWYCRECASQPSLPPARGVFPSLVRSFAKRNPQAYKLHRSIREYFEDVITGDDGEYEESGAPASKAK